MEPIEKELTDKIIGTCIEVSKILGSGFLESVYHRALLVELDKQKLSYKSQVKLEVKYKRIIVGDFIADVIVEDKVILELKAVKEITNEMQSQLINYLNATGIRVGYIINFGKPKLDWKRIVN